MTIRQTIAAPAFDKFYLEGPWAESGIHPDIHHMKAPDLGAFHDHPWAMRSFVMRGSYVEEVLAADGSTSFVTHRQGDSFLILAEHVHRIVELPEGECWTVAVPEGPPERCWAYFEVRDGRVWKRDHDKPDWQAVAA